MLRPPHCITTLTLFPCIYVHAGHASCPLVLAHFRQRTIPHPRRATSTAWSQEQCCPGGRSCACRHHEAFATVISEPLRGGRSLQCNLVLASNSLAKRVRQCRALHADLPSDSGSLAECKPLMALSWADTSCTMTDGRVGTSCLHRQVAVSARQLACYDSSEAVHFSMVPSPLCVALAREYLCSSSTCFMHLS